MLNLFERRLVSVDRLTLLSWNFDDVFLVEAYVLVGRRYNRHMIIVVLEGIRDLLASSSEHRAKIDDLGSSRSS
jgi:hypothetical protein